MDSLVVFICARLGRIEMSLESTITGAAVGGALTYAAVAQPRIILDQFAFKDMHMLRVFMTATAGSA